MFPAWHIALTALVTSVLTAVLTAAGTAGWRGRTSAHPPLLVGDVVGVGLAAGLGVLLWRLGANVPPLNDDPIPGVSPADVLSTPLAQFAASTYLRLRGGAGGRPLGALISGARSGVPERLAIAPAVAALVALIVNVITI